MKLGKIFIILFICVFSSNAVVADISGSGEKSDEEKTYEEKHEDNSASTKESCGKAATKIDQKEGTYNTSFNLGNLCISLSGNYIEDLKAAFNYAISITKNGYIPVSKTPKPTPKHCDCNMLFPTKYRDTNYNYKALNHLFGCVGDYIRHWKDYTFKSERAILQLGDENIIVKKFKQEYPYDSVVAELAQGSPTPWRYNIFLPEIKDEFIRNIIASREGLTKKALEEIIETDNEKYRGYIRNFIINEVSKNKDTKAGYGKYCHVINEKQWNKDSPNKIKLNEGKGENPKRYLPYERIYNPEQSPWYPRNTNVMKINTSMEDGKAVGAEIQYLSTRVKMSSCDAGGIGGAGDKGGCEPCNAEGDPVTCTPYWWHTEYGRCGDKAPKCSGNIRESVDILEARAGEYRFCLDAFTFSKCLSVNCLGIKDPYFAALSIYAGEIGLWAMENIYPRSGGYCCSIIEPPVTPADAMGLHYNMLEVRDYRNAWRDFAPSTRPNLEPLSIGAPRSIWKRSEIAHEHLEGKDIQEYNYWWPWWARTKGDVISRNCTGLSAEFQSVMSVVQPYWKWPDTGTTSPHNDPFHDSISPGVPGANCGYGGWAETKLYQARCMKYFKMNCICRYEQTFKIGSAESYVLHMLGGQYQYKNENGNLTSGFWPFPWQGYVSAPITDPKETADNPNGFPIGKNDGYFEEVENGFDNAKSGDIVVWDHSRGKHPLAEPSSGGYNSSYLMLPHTAYITQVNNQRSKQNDDPKTRKSQDYVKVIEYNYGKVPDSCGNTTNWNRRTDRTITPYGSMNKDIQKISDRESVTCLDPENSPCEDPFWEVGKRSPKVYRLKPYQVSNSDKCNYTGLDSYRVLEKEYYKADKKYQQSGSKGKLQDYLGVFYKLKEQIEENIDNGCYPPPSWNELIKNSPPNIIRREAFEFLPSMQMHEQTLIGTYPPLEPVLKAAAGGANTTGYTETIEEATDLGEFLLPKPNIEVGSGVNPITNPITPTNPTTDCEYVATIDPKGNPEVILDTIWDASKTNYDEISKAYTYLNSLANIVENEGSGAEARLKELVNKLKSENDIHTETMMALMSYQYYDTCCSESSEAIYSKNLALESRAKFKDAIKNVDDKISSGDELSNILPDLKTALREYFYFEASAMNASKNILYTLAGCSGSDYSKTEKYNSELSTNIKTIVNSLNSIDSFDIDNYKDLADIFYNDNYGALKISKETMKLLSDFSKDINNDVLAKSRQCSPDLEFCNVSEKPPYNPLVIGKKSENCYSVARPTDDEPIDLTCQEAPRTCSQAPDCWKKPLEPTCDMYGELDFTRATDNPFVEYPLSDEKHRDVGYSRDLVAKYLYNKSDFSTADGSKYILPLVNNFPVEWCDLDFVQERLIKSASEIKSGVTVAVITSERYKNGHSSIVYEHDAKNNCVYLYGQNWLELQCQKFTDDNCNQSYSSFNKPSISPNCIPVSDISYMWNAVCDDKHPCD